jgi:hypothetical protein
MSELVNSDSPDAPPPTPEITKSDGWRIVVMQTMQHLHLDFVENPSQCITAIDAALFTNSEAILQANNTMQQMAAMQEVIKNQGNILDAFAMVIGLPNGSMYMDMVPILQALKEKADAVPLSDS